MRRKVFLERIFHREKWRIAIRFEFDEKIRERVKSLPGYAFSSTLRCFYVDDSEDNLKLVLKTVRDIADVDISRLTRKPDRPSEGGVQDVQADKTERNAENEPVKKGDDDHPFPKTAKEIPVSGSGERSWQSDSRESGYGPVEFRINEKEGLLIIKFTGRYDNAWVKELITYSGCRYNKSRREWSLTWSKITVDSLADYFASMGIKVSIRKQVVNEALRSERRITGDDIREKELGKEALDGLDSLAMYLDENRYSIRTRETYLSALEFYFRYFSPKVPLEITEDEISMFIYDYIIRLGYSASYQNQMVSAIKTFYQISGKGRVNPELLERPRRSRALPKVFSKDEVSSILNSPRNSKHKMLLWMIYSCGLRRSEVTNIKLTDLDRERGIMHIREGKGRVDRIVPVSGKVWEKLDEYLGAYKPGKYVFEGQAGGRYSSESVYHVFKDAMERAGIRKDVGVHSLRHSYATHLHENGLDIRYIQELLGHKSTRTTEIYTHVSRRNLIQVRSPIEDLDVK